MTKREFWLKLFSENDIALASAIHLCERFVTPESLEREEAYFAEKLESLNDDVDQDTIEAVFPAQMMKHEGKTNKKSKLKELRKAAGLTQAELSEKTGLSLSLIKKYEQETKNIHNAQYATIIKLCGFLDCDPEDLL